MIGPKLSRHGNSSVFRFEAGMHQDVIDRFERDHQSIQAKSKRAGIPDQSGGEQVWVWFLAFRMVRLLQVPVHGQVPHDILQRPHLAFSSESNCISWTSHAPEAIKGISRKWTRWVRPTKWVADRWR